MVFKQGERIGRVADDVTIEVIVVVIATEVFEVDQLIAARFLQQQ